MIKTPKPGNPNITALKPLQGPFFYACMLDITFKSAIGQEVKVIDLKSFFYLKKGKVIKELSGFGKRTSVEVEFENEDASEFKFHQLTAE